MSENFIHAVLSGEALWDEADDWVDRWHDDDAANMSLHDFLGMTWDEYRLWSEQPKALRLIIAAHERGEPVEALLQTSHDYALAARGLDRERLEEVVLWLEHTGRIQRA